MPKILIFLIASLVLSGCYSEDDYQEDWTTVNCEWYDDCQLLDTLNYESVEDCVDEGMRKYEQDQEEGVETCPVYDSAAAKECIEGIEALACDERSSNFPQACDEVCTAEE
jgi:hypothetical protein